MIVLLSKIGRVSIVVSAVLTILGGAVLGNYYGLYLDRAAYGDFTLPAGAQFTPRSLIFALLGGVLGLLTAGTAYGAVAALFDIQDSLRVLRGRTAIFRDDGEDDRPVSRIGRREPTI